jgi:hypothetical protein
MSEITFVVEELPEGGFIAHAIGEAIFIEADTLPELREAVRDAVHCHFDACEEPQRMRLDVAGEETVA